MLFHVFPAFCRASGMHSLRRLLRYSKLGIPVPDDGIGGIRAVIGIASRPFSTRAPPATGEEEWNDAWEAAWLPQDQQWEPDATCPARDSALPPSEMDADTKAFVAEMDERWAERRAARVAGGEDKNKNNEKKKNAVDEYRMKKQRIHSGLWVKEIEKLEEARLGGGVSAGDDIDRLLDSCSEIFDSGNVELNDSKIPSTSEFKTKPDGWEATSKNPDGNIWDITQREEDILLQEFERRIAFSKFQLASFIKTHIFSRRRPVDGWKYMIEVIGPNARRREGSVQRLPSLADPATQPYKEEKPAIGPNLTSFKGR